MSGLSKIIGKGLDVLAHGGDDAARVAGEARSALSSEAGRILSTPRVSSAAERAVNAGDGNFPRRYLENPHQNFVHGGVQHDPRYRPPLNNRLEHGGSTGSGERTRLDELLDRRAAGNNGGRLSGDMDRALSRAAESNGVDSLVTPSQSLRPDVSTLGRVNPTETLRAVGNGTKNTDLLPRATDAATGVAGDGSRALMDTIRDLARESETVIRQGGRVGNVEMKRSGDLLEMNFVGGPHNGKSVLIEGDTVLVSGRNSSVHQSTLSLPPTYRVPSFVDGVK